MKALKTRILSLRMDQDEVLDIHKWVLCRFKEDGTVSVEIDREAMREDGYIINEINPYQQLRQLSLSHAHQAMSHKDIQRMREVQYSASPSLAESLFGKGMFGC